MSQSNDFVSYVFSIIASDKGARADFRRADNDAYEWRIWPYLSRFIADLDEDVYRRRVYALIGSAIAKSRSDEDGQVPFGMAFRKLSKDNGGAGKDRFPPRLMRILSADGMEELIDISRPLLSYMCSEGIRLDFSRLLDDFLSFRFPVARQKVKARWAQEYLSVRDGEE